jgi:hypothetical protein
MSNIEYRQSLQLITSCDRKCKAARNALQHFFTTVICCERGIRKIRENQMKGGERRDLSEIEISGETLYIQIERPRLDEMRSEQRIG